MFPGTSTLLALAVAATPAGPATAATLPDLLDAIAERNAIAYDVAAAKYPQDKPVVDLPREQVVLDGKRAQAEALGLDADAVVAFYEQLIAANKLVQHAQYQQFRRGRIPPPAPSLEQIRQRIDAVDQRLLTLWPQVQDLRAQRGCTRQLADALHERGSRYPQGDAVQPLALLRATVGLCLHDGRAEDGTQR